eukprot:g73104.t1
MLRYTKPRDQSSGDDGFILIGPKSVMVGSHLQSLLGPDVEWVFGKVSALSVAFKFCGLPAKAQASELGATCC